MHNFIQKNSRKIFLGLVALIVAASFGADIFLFRTEASSVREDSNSVVAHVSPFADPAPRIDEEAASIVYENEEADCDSSAAVPPAAALPAGAWIFLLGAYIFLLLFNLSADFGKTRKIRWFWETVFTLLALSAWFVYDPSRSFTWYPLYVLKLGLITYLFYIYFFIGKKEKNKTEPGE